MVFMKHNLPKKSIERSLGKIFVSRVEYKVQNEINSEKHAIHIRISKVRIHNFDSNVHITWNYYVKKT